MQTLYLIVPLAPLLGAVLAGILGRVIGRRGAHSVTIALMIVSLGAALTATFSMATPSTGRSIHGSRQGTCRSTSDS
jgi:NADH:ubiquinone oxidoreductase subunit 5 (subunit L)/multisubunit Na+/H+ antiporter MnhA subunit